MPSHVTAWWRARRTGVLATVPTERTRPAPRAPSLPRMLARYVAATIVLTAVAACADDTPSGPRPGGAPRAEAYVASPPALTWLAPLGTGAADSATFDAMASPVVEVCAWTGTACAAAPVARFSTTPAGADLPLTVNPAAGRYEAAWDLADARLTTRRTYRVRVLQGATELGALSVDVVRGRWALTRTDGTLAPLQAASALPIRFHLAFAPLAPAEVAGILDLQNAAAATIDSGPGVTTIPDALARVAAVLRQDPRVETVTLSGDDLLEVRYRSGVTGGVLITEKLANGSELRGGSSAPSGVAFGPTAVRTRASAVTSAPRLYRRITRDAAAVSVSSAVEMRTNSGRAARPLIPSDNQARRLKTAGRTRRAPRFSSAAASAARDSAKQVKSNRVLIFEPSQTEFSPWDEGDEVQAIAQRSDLPLQVTHLTDDRATVAALRSLTDYGVVVIAAHGRAGSLFLTGEVVTPASAPTYSADVRAGRLTIQQTVVVRRTSTGFKTDPLTTTVYGVTDGFIRNLSGRFPNSVIVADYCEGTKSPQRLAEAFRAKGAPTYLGFDKVVYSDYVKSTATAFLQGFLVDGKTAGESYVPSSDPMSPYGRWMLVGDPDTHLAPAVTVSLTVSPSTVQAGIPVTLTFTVSASATKPLTNVYIVAGCDLPAPLPNATSYNGSCSITETFGDTTMRTYDAVATASGTASSAHAEAVVTITPRPPAPIVSLTVSPTTVEASRPVTLTFTVRVSATSPLTTVFGLPCDLPALSPNATSYSGSCSFETTLGDRGTTYTDTYWVMARAQGAVSEGRAEAYLTVTPPRP